VSHAAVDLVVLTDYLVADPRMVRDLHSQGVAHLLSCECETAPGWWGRWPFRV
jgi:hypothetical protein